MLQEADQPIMAYRVEERSDIGIHDPVHLRAEDPGHQRVREPSAHGLVPWGIMPAAPGPHSPRPPPFAPPPPAPAARPRSAASSLLWRSPTSHARASSATAPRLPDAGRGGYPPPVGREISQVPTQSFRA